jgi:hypothetical protein
METNRDRVLQTIVDLQNARRPASRVLIAQLLHEKLSVVDDAVKRLKEDGDVRTVVPGIFEAVAQFPPSRPISRTILPDGRSKIELGDELLELTPHEAMVLGKMLHGDAMEMSHWNEERRHGAQVARLEAQVRNLEKRVRDVARRGQRQHAGQPDLFMVAA